MSISASEHSKKSIKVLGKKMAYVEMGEGDPIIFQHGNPTSSYLWRNIMPAMAPYGRCIAVDLIGMGDSEPLDNSGPDSYRFEDHAKYLYACWEALGVRERVTLIVHDWGSALGFNWARLHPASVRGIAYMEAVLKPYETMRKWKEIVEAPASEGEFDADAPGIFDMLRSPAGDEFCLDHNGFVEQILTGFTMRELGEEEMTVYRRPFAQAGESRRPTLTWPREMPIGGQPADVVATANAYAEFLADTAIPKLFIRCEPGALIRGEMLNFARSFKNQSEVSVPGLHFAQEDSPEQISAAIVEWFSTLAG